MVEHVNCDMRPTTTGQRPDRPTSKGKKKEGRHREKQGPAKEKEFDGKVPTTSRARAALSLFSASGFPRVCSLNRAVVPPRGRK
jgi:hypothetical protein